jgi:hypothetical protein
LDLFVAPTRANAERFIKALADFFGGPAPSYVTIRTLLDPNLIVQRGVAPVRVDVPSHAGVRGGVADADAKFGRSG